MANTKSAKKKVKQDKVRRLRNLARTTAIKTSIKKAIIAIELKQDAANTLNIIDDVASKLARAKNKGVIHKNTAARKLSRLRKRYNKFVNSKESQPSV